MSLHWIALFGVLAALVISSCATPSGSLQKRPTATERHEPTGPNPHRQ